jgi:hypothetical protein
MTYYYSASDNKHRYENLIVEDAYSLDNAALIAENECKRRGMTFNNVRTFLIQ